jgi:hypothetical protein
MKTFLATLGLALLTFSSAYAACLPDFPHYFSRYQEGRDSQFIDVLPPAVGSYYLDTICGSPGTSVWASNLAGSENYKLYSNEEQGQAWSCQTNLHLFLLRDVRVAVFDLVYDFPNKDSHVLVSGCNQTGKFNPPLAVDEVEVLDEVVD